MKNSLEKFKSTFKQVDKKEWSNIKKFEIIKSERQKRKKKKQRRKVNKLKEFMGLHQVDQYMIMGVPEREEREQQAYLDK